MRLGGNLLKWKILRKRADGGNPPGSRRSRAGRLGDIAIHLTKLNCGTDDLSATFAALTDPTRRAILMRLAEGEAAVVDLAAPFEISAPAISRHLKVLESAGLIERRAEDQWCVCRLRGDGLRDAAGWLERYRVFWEESLDRLPVLLEAPAPERRRPGHARTATSPSRRKRR